MELTPFDDVFHKRIFRIPDYQRGYAWRREQLVDFWEDLLNLEEGRMHYTGMLTIKERPAKDALPESQEYWLVRQNYAVCDVVDGQQRLTTFVILVQCMIEALRGLAEHAGKSDEDIIIADQRLSDVVGQYLFKEKPPEKLLRTHLFGYHEDNPSYEYLKRVILGDTAGGPLEESFYTLNLDNAKRYFAGQLQPLNGERIIELFGRLTHRMLFNVYSINEDLDVFVAFETMNNRGKKLSNLELLKNRMIYLTTLFPVNEQRQDEIAEVRAIINDSWKAVYKWLGYNKQNPLNDDDFLKGHWIVYFKYSRQMGDDYIRDLLGERFSPKRVYRESEANVALVESVELAGVEERSSEEEDDALPNGEALNGRDRLNLADIAAYAKSLSEFARAWYETFFPDQSLPHSHLALKDIEWIEKLKRLGYTYFRPLIAAMLCRVDSEADRLALYQAVERFIFLAFRLGRSNSNYRSSVFYGLARQLYKGEIESSVILDQIGRDLGWCFREEGTYETQHFSAHMHKLFDSREGYYSWQELHYFLFEYEAYLAANRGGHKIHWESFSKREKDKVSIEHIYPQTPEDRSWKEAFPRSKKEQKALQNSLGNLLALSQSINSSLQNDPFDAKKRVKRGSDGQVLRAGYANGSHSEIAVSEYAAWTPEAIKDRGLEMIRFMEHRWNFSIASDTERLELLGLSFLEEAR
jgi:hypothetical protein